MAYPSQYTLPAPGPSSITMHSSRNTQLDFGPSSSSHDDISMHPDIFDHLEPHASPEHFYLSLTSSQANSDESSSQPGLHTRLSTPLDHDFVDPRQLFDAGGPDPSTPLAPSSSMFANRSVPLVSTPSTPPDTPKARALDLAATSPTLPSGAIASSSIRSTDRRKHSNSLSVSFGPSSHMSVDSLSRRPLRTLRSSVPAPSALKGSKGKARSSTNVATRSTWTQPAGPHPHPAKVRASASASLSSASVTYPSAFTPFSPLLSESKSSSGNGTTSSSSSSTTGRTKLHIPLALPNPHFPPSPTDPHTDVVAHLARIGLGSEAEDARRYGWTTGYALLQLRDMLGDTWRLALNSARASTFTSTSTDGEDAEARGKARLAAVNAAAQSKMIQVHIPAADAPSCPGAGSGSGSTGPRLLPPTHVIAVLPSGSGRTSKSSSSSTSSRTGGSREEAPTLFPIHSLLYALQCRSLPDGCFDPSRDPISEPISAPAQEGEEAETTATATATATVRVIQLRVPQPSTFGITHEYVCGGSAQRLLNHLVPLKFIHDSIVARAAAVAAFSTPASAGAEEGEERTPTPTPTPMPMPREGAGSSSSSSTATPTPTTLPPTLSPQAQAIQALADLSTKQLLALLGTIRSVYTNGAAIGLVDAAYWKTLAAAWELVVGGLAIRKGRQADWEIKGVRQAMGGLGIRGLKEEEETQQREGGQAAA
ncbi:hypothetical protein OC834_005862 [Tilletia horrida]|nr:hypothetical protein OC834_005862 [Tilletia horrida]